MTAQNAYAAGYIAQGQYVICDPMGRVVRIADFLTNGLGTIYRATPSGLVRVHF